MIVYYCLKRNLFDFEKNDLNLYDLKYKYIKYYYYPLSAKNYIFRKTGTSFLTRLSFLRHELQNFFNNENFG